MDPKPTPVPPAKPVGPVRARWGWAEPSAWTDRMLTALEEGVKGGVWFSLIDKVYAPANLRAALTEVVANKGAPGVDHVTVEQFAGRADANLKVLGEHLRTGTYRPQAIRRVYIPKAGSPEKRPLGIPTVRDRVAQAAVVHVLEPIFERDFAPTSYGFRPGRGAQQALDRVEELLAGGHRYVVDADLKSYFDTIPHDRLLQRLREKVADGPLLRLLESFLTAGVLEDLRAWVPTAGAPQGAVLSPLLSNIYLDPLDHLLGAQGLAMVRYADDFVILCRTRPEADRALAVVQEWVASNGLRLHPDKTRLVDAAADAFDFLGYRFEGARRSPRPKSLAKLKEAVRSKTKRTDGRSLGYILADLNRTLYGWYGYFWRSHERVFSRLDGWIRRRLRSLLRQRAGLPGVSRHGADEARWPVAFFAAQGLFSLKAAHAAAVNPR